MKHVQCHVCGVVKCAMRQTVGHRAIGLLPAIYEVIGTSRSGSITAKIASRTSIGRESVLGVCRVTYPSTQRP